MNSSDRPNTGTRSAVVSYVWSLCLAGLAICVTVTVLVAVLLPGKNGPLQLLAMKAGLVQPASGVSSHVPKGQLQADARTFIASLRWLLEPDWNSPAIVANGSVIGLSRTNFVLNS